jgi:hypothetical protein
MALYEELCQKLLSSPPDSKYGHIRIDDTLINDHISKLEKDQELRFACNCCTQVGFELLRRNSDEEDYYYNEFYQEQLELEERTYDIKKCQENAQEWFTMFVEPVFKEEFVISFTRISKYNGIIVMSYNDNYYFGLYNICSENEEIGFQGTGFLSLLFKHSTKESLIKEMIKGGVRRLLDTSYRNGYSLFAHLKRCRYDDDFLLKINKIINKIKKEQSAQSEKEQLPST